MTETEVTFTADVCRIFHIFDMINEYVAVQNVKLILDSACVQYKKCMCVF